MRARPDVAASFSWPYRVILVLASYATFKSREPEPHVGSYAVVEPVVLAWRMPSICAIIRLTSAGV